MISAHNLRTGEECGFAELNLPEGIDPHSWAVLASYLLHTNMAGSLAMHAFNPRCLVEQHIGGFVLGSHSIAYDDWVCRLPREATGTIAG